jgi:murein DD-endopeptidase MepM/ murein hydrolase activator NlpD
VATRVAGIAASLALVMTAVGFGAPAAADPHDDLAAVNRQVAATHAAMEASSDRVARAADAYTLAMTALPRVRARLIAAEGVLAGAQARAEAARTASERATAALALAESAAADATHRLDAGRDAVGRFSAEAYKGGHLADVVAMLTVTKPADVVAGLTYLDHVAQGERRMLDAVTTAQAWATSEQGVRARRALAAQQASDEAAAAFTAASGAAAEADAAAREQEALVRQCQDALAVARREQAATEARYQELRATSDRITAQIRALARGGPGPGAPTAAGVVLAPGLRLPMPVVGWKSSDFGMRFDPFYHVWRLHAGVDLAAPGGAPIWAVAAGRVIQAGWNGGYGNYTCLYHGIYRGKGFATCYAHQSEILVRVGQWVSPGQVIGRVGTTGASTGTHLHFEVRLDGVPVNPLPWLPACLC